MILKGVDMNSQHDFARQQSGMILIEALLAILIFSLGILALVGLQATAVKQSADAKYRTEAALLANEIIGQMWVSDRTTAALQANFNSPGGADYNNWLARVGGVLPGVAANSPTAPTIAIDGTGYRNRNGPLECPQRACRRPDPSVCCHRPDQVEEIDVKTRLCDQRSGQSGFSLIEIMVGMVIGLLAIIVMMQVFAVSEERKRTANAGSDAQNSAVIALDGIQRDIGQSGYGFALTRLLGCNLQLPFGAPVPMAPVIINPPVAVIPAGDANTDTLLISYGLGNDQPEGYNVLSQSGTTYTIVGTSMLRGRATRRSGSPRRPPAARQRWCSAPSGGECLGRFNCRLPRPARALFNLGATPRFLAYAVRNGNLVVCDYMAADCGDATAASLANPAIWRLVAENIASLRAQYGRDTSGHDGWHGGHLRPDDTDDGLSVGEDPGDPPGPGGTQRPVRKRRSSTNL